MRKKINRRKAVIILAAFFVSCNSSINPVDWVDATPKIAIQPYGDIQQAEIDSVAKAIEKMYPCDLYVYDHNPMPERAYTEIRYPRYRADTLVQILSEEVADTIDVIVGLTNKDISITKYKNSAGEIKEPTWQYVDFGIFGLGRVGGKACVVSSNRLHKNATDKQFYTRLCRIACHEVGHVMGLHHCPELHCLMNDANEKIATIDQSTGELCESCAAKISY